MDFPAVKKYENHLRFDEIIIKIGWRVFLRHTVDIAALESGRKNR